jgi:hypothetical protein
MKGFLVSNGMLYTVNTQLEVKVRITSLNALNLKSTGGGGGGHTPRILFLGLPKMFSGF